MASLEYYFNRALVCGALTLSLPMVGLSASTIDRIDQVTEEPKGSHHRHHEERGETGKEGERGKKGEKGERGERGHRGERGARGATGATGAAFAFPADIGQSLVFAYTFNVAEGDVGTTITPFVVRPDGVVVVGTPQTPLVAGPINFSIVVSDPPFGGYQVGVQTINGGVLALTSTLIETVTASRDGSITTLVTPNLGLALGVGAESQISANFAYGPTIVP